MKVEPEIISLRVKCPTTGKTFVLTKSELHFNAWDSECETCGSHGKIEVSFTCKSCKTTHKKPREVYHTIEISSW